MARSPRGVTFFACAKKVTKESTPQAARPALRSGSASEPGIFVRHIHVPYENAAHPGRRPSGFTWPARRASWGPGSGSKGKVKSSARVSICQARLVGPLRSGSPGGSNPAGAAHKDVRRFRPGQDAPSENSHRDCAPAAQRRADRRGVFLWVSGFHCGEPALAPSCLTVRACRLLVSLACPLLAFNVGCACWRRSMQRSNQWTRHLASARTARFYQMG